MAWGTLTIGSLTLKETDIVSDVTNANTGERSVRLEGRETNPGDTQATIEAKQTDIMGMIGRVMPVEFERKSSYNGFYRIADTNTELEKWAEGPGQVRWSLAMEYIGPDNSVDMESVLANVVRANDFALTGERWHAPARGHHSYYTGSVAGSPLFRAGEGGDIIVYRSIPAGVNPRWGASVSDFQTGRARFISGGMERFSPGIKVPADGWELSNRLVRVRPDTSGNSTLLVAFYHSGQWQERAWDIKAGAGTIIPGNNFYALTVMRLENELVSLRVLTEIPGVGDRVLIDLLLRRGARFVEGQVQRSNSGSIEVSMDTADPVTDMTHYVISTTADPSGLKMVAGSARNFDVAGNGGLAVTSTVFLDFFLGAEVPTPDPGDAAADLAQQYIGAMPERTRVIRR